MLDGLWSGFGPFVPLILIAGVFAFLSLLGRVLYELRD